MTVNGLAKMSLLDYPGKICATVFFAGCNFRCPFCHNASLVLDTGNAQQIGQDEVLSFLSTRRGLLDGVCVTGGEPLLQPQLGLFLREIKQLGFCVKLDTNGSMPERLSALVNEGVVDYVAMDIKNSIPKYPETAGLPIMDIDKIMRSVEFLKAGAVPYEFRTTLVRELHTQRDIEDIAEWLSGASQYFLQTFVDSGDLICSGLSPFTKQETEFFKQLLDDKIQYVGIRGV